ncbi:uncharacterized protein LOC127585852 [Pristis pectinata]|uniref:uncharacterized protein LOC127585852 n=1 Tax=Pristis pectinata TaxID=685728 RepID=UPI00223D7CF3|nr:uncharacterized protein LOC127585852 [Pristis pectinata]
MSPTSVSTTPGASGNREAPTPGSRTPEESLELHPLQQPLPRIETAVYTERRCLCVFNAFTGHWPHVRVNSLGVSADSPVPGVSDWLREMFLAAAFWSVCFVTAQRFCTGCGTSAELTVHQTQVTGVINQSVLLPVSYEAGCQHYIKISWRYEAFPTSFLIWSFLNVSGNYSQHIFTWNSYGQRTTFFPENASVILHNLQHNDTGTYIIKIKGKSWSATGQINLTILPEAVAKEQSDGTQGANNFRIPNIIRLALGSLLVSLSFTAALVGNFRK